MKDRYDIDWGWVCTLLVIVLIFLLTPWLVREWVYHDEREQIETWREDEKLDAYPSWRREREKSLE